MDIIETIITKINKEISNGNITKPSELPKEITGIICSPIIAKHLLFDLTETVKDIIEQ